MTTVIAFGDSLVQGVVNPNGRPTISRTSFVKLCEKKLGISVLNKARLGCTVERGEEIFDRFIDTVRSSDARYVVFDFGGNDCDFDWKRVCDHPDEKIGPYVDRASFRAHYRSLIQKVRTEGKEPILLSLPPIVSEKFFKWISRGLCEETILRFLGGDVGYLADWHMSYNLAVFNLALEQKVRIIDISSCFLQEKNYKDFFSIDGIHPNEEGHALIAETICAYVRDGNLNGS